LYFGENAGRAETRRRGAIVEARQCYFICNIIRRCYTNNHTDPNAAGYKTMPDLIHLSLLKVEKKQKYARMSAHTCKP
jgi:hypothetical protein